MAKAIRKQKSPSEEDKIIGENIRRIRRERDLTQVELGTAMSITFQQIQKYERGINRIASGRLPAFARVLQCDVAELFHGLETKFNPSTTIQSEPVLHAVRLKAARRKLVKLVDDSQSLETLSAIITMLEMTRSKLSQSDADCA